jgi:DNA-binding response OmpR family regulator
MTTILIVDDDPDFVEITRMILSTKGYHVETASGGDQALRRMQEELPDLVLLDVMMDGILDGVHVANAIAETAALAQVPVVMISSITSSSMAEMFPTDAYLPINMWITKPVQPSDLLARVAKLVGDP